MPTRFLRRPEIEERTGLSAMHISRLERAGAFPKRVRLGPNSVAWVEKEVQDWQEQRAAERGPLPQPQKATKALTEKRASRRAERAVDPRAA